MSLPVQIKDGGGSGRWVRVNADGTIPVSVVASSSSDLSTDQLTIYKQLREYFTDGTSSHEMAVDGSTTPVEFTVAAESDKTKWLVGTRILFNGTEFELSSNDFRRFGSATATNTPLTNGVEFFVTQSGITTNYFTNPIQRTGEFMDFADDFTNFVNAISAQSDFLSFDFVFDTPIVLPEGSTDKLTIRISDDLTALDLFQAVARGYQELL